MAIEIEYFGITGMVGPGSNDLLLLKHAPTTGLNGAYDIALDPIDGPAQVYGADFGVTHAGSMAGVTLNLENSDIKDVMNNPQGETGILYLRVVYNY